jgi:cell wall-associated NlpC family hydrolase
VGDVFNGVEKVKNDLSQHINTLSRKANTTFGTEKEDVSSGTYNPFLNKNGELANPYINYRKLLDDPNVSDSTKKYITEATGLSPNIMSQGVTADGKKYVLSRYNNIRTFLGADSENDSTTNKTKTKGSIAEAAKKYIGTPYVWGGESMAEGGMDCSGFVYNALKDAGYDVDRVTAQEYRNYGTTVSKSDMQPGDLIFFGKNGNASHIGIYLGNGQMIHSAGGSKNTKDNPGKGVSIVGVNHRSDFIEARRY